MGITVNDEKTEAAEDSFIFPGFEFKNLCSWKIRKRYIGARPSRKALKSLAEKVHDKTDASKGCLETSDIVKDLNPVLRGWANYYRVGSCSKAFKIMGRYVIGRLRHWMGRKHKWKTKGYKKYSDSQLYEMSGLINLMSLVPTYSRTKS